MDAIKENDSSFFAYFDKKKKNGIVRYCLLFSFIQIIFSLLLALVFIVVDESEDPVKHTFFFAVIIAPILETILLQALPFIVCRKLGLRRWLTFIMMSVPFALLHHHSGYLSVINAFLGGVIFSATFIVWEKKTYYHALLVTMVIHSLHNLFFVLIKYFNELLKGVDSGL